MKSFIPKNRLEAFSDGVIAIIITIMVLELRPPHNADIAALKPLMPVFLSYLLSFIYLGIYWNNHHHLLHAAKSIDGKVMWANLLLLFCLSLFPFGMAWVGDRPHDAWPAAIYGVIFLSAAISYTLLQNAIISLNGKDSAMAAAIGSDRKGKISMAGYVTAIALAFVHPWISDGIYALVALIWVVPDRRIENIHS